MLKKLVKRTLRKDSDSEDDANRVSARGRRGKAKAPLLDAATLDALKVAVAGKHKMSSAALSALFEKYDADEAGLVDDATFVKCVKKLGVSWRKEQVGVILECFRLGANAVDYYAFVDFATDSRDTEKLSAIALDLQQTIEQYDKRSGEQPFNVFDALARLDKKEKLWLKPDVFQEFLESKRPIDFELTSKQINLLTDRFSFEFDDRGTSGVDYTQFSRWLQPSFHFKLKQLRQRIQQLVSQAKKQRGLDCKDIFKAMDADSSGFVTRLEFKEGLFDMGLPLTEAQMKCLVDSIDADGDGKVNYREFAATFAIASENDDDDETKKTPRRAQPRIQAIIDPSVLAAMVKSVHGRTRQNSLQVAAVFEKYDTDERGTVDDAHFIKGLGKLGIKLKKADLDRLLTCFRPRKRGAGSVDYYAFVDYLMQTPDTKKLEKVRSKVQSQLRAHDKASGEQPFNVHAALSKLDTKELGWLPTDAVRDFFDGPRGSVAFDLSSSDLKALLDNFEYGYIATGKTKPIRGIDYDQCARWLQPSMHLDLPTLHATVQRLFHRAQMELKLKLRDVFKDIDEDNSGTITRIELKETLQAMGLPLTNTQIKCLIDEYDTDGDGKIAYTEFVAAIGDAQKDDEDATTSKVVSKGSAVLTRDVNNAITKAVRGKRKVSSTELVSYFEKLDTAETGLLDIGAFEKGLSKAGIKLKKDQFKAVVGCFKKGKGVDYYAFADFATDSKDTDKLAAIGDRLRGAIAKFDKSSGEQPYNALKYLRKLDRKSTQHIKPDTFEGFLAENAVVKFGLKDSEVSAVVNRFKYDYAGTAGVDYEQFARWLQPSLHFDLEELHDHVKRLFRKTKLSWRDIFEEIDADSNGVVTRIEFKEALMDLGMPLTDAQMRLLMDEYDTDGDGKMAYKEFIKALSTASADDDDDSASPTSPSFRKKMAARFTFSSWSKTKKADKKPVEAESDTPPKIKSKRPKISLKGYIMASLVILYDDVPSLFSPKAKASTRNSSESSTPRKRSKTKAISSDDGSPPPKPKPKARREPVVSSEDEEPPRKRSVKQQHRKLESSDEAPLKSKKKYEASSRFGYAGRQGKIFIQDQGVEGCGIELVEHLRGSYTEESEVTEAPSPCASDESASSGMNVADLRKYRDRARTKSKAKRRRAVESSTDSNASDAEYLTQMKRALRTAFDFYDVDQSNSIDRDELGHILRAVGDDLTTDELETVLRAVDVDSSGQIEFDEFYLMMKQRLRQQRVVFRAKRELEIRAIFDQMDTDRNGMLDADEFHHALVAQLRIPLTNDEFYAVLDETDTSNDGLVDIDEFSAFMLLVEQVSGHHAPARSFSSAAIAGMKKIARGAPRDPEVLLLSQLGVPTNFRHAVTTTARRLQKHTMEYVLSFPPPETVYNLAQHGNLAVIPTQTQQAGYSEAWAAVAASEALETQAVVSLKFAKGVPTPYDRRERDVVGRKVRVCFFDMSDATGVATVDGIRRLEGQIVGNIHEIPVAWSKKEEDVWYFSKASTQCDDYKFMVRTNAPADGLFLFIEFVIVLKSESAHEIRQVATKTKYKVPPPAHATTPVEMACCWAKIPVNQLLSSNGQDVVRFDVALYGGTILNPVELDEDEISRRRTGWRALAKALKAYTPPQLHIKSLQVPRLTLPEKLSIAQLPATIITPYSAVVIIQDYMAVMKTVISTLESPSHVYTCEPALKLFPRILDDADVYDAFRAVVATEMRGPFKTAADRQQRFKDVIMRMWPALTIPRPRFDEAEDAKEADVDSISKHLDGIAQGKFGFNDVKDPSTPFDIREVSFERLL
ncbi:hypothetical protein ACHHYP_05191 [Achlya hypogyna]|uniref:EF-hand domain-containing protein n=1 Tax=Achlya hypogyna TaxID=1202772 RepID=A0A1V9YYR8_ACHHY|nr:hypothetical protein ACHHYP_05191 [Achlya hypogyna]